jgi:hypothetical protein
MIKSNILSQYLDSYHISKRGNSRKGKKNKLESRYKTDIKLGHIYENLTVIEVNKNKVICKCKCGNIKELPTSRIRNKQVKSCGCLIYRKGTKNPLFNGFGNIPKGVYTKCTVNASDRNILWNLNIQDLDEQFIKQNKKCAISGVDIGFNNIKSKTRVTSTASLDRIDSSKFYTKDNVQWVHKTVQQMKWLSNQEEFIKWCQIIAANNS